MNDQVDEKAANEIIENNRKLIIQKYEEFFSINTTNDNHTEQNGNNAYLKKKSLYEDGTNENNNFLNTIELDDDNKEELNVR